MPMPVIEKLTWRFEVWGHYRKYGTKATMDKYGITKEGVRSIRRNAEKIVERGKK